MSQQLGVEVQVDKEVYLSLLQTSPTHDNQIVHMTRLGPESFLLTPVNKTGPKETYPWKGVIFSQNIQGLSGLIINMSISWYIMINFIQDTWIIGNYMSLILRNLFLHHNQLDKGKGETGRVTGGMVIILSPTVVTAWKELVLKNLLITTIK